MNNYEQINNLVDSRSEKLWQEINTHFTVTIQQTKDGNYGCFTQNDKAIIYIDFQNLCKDSFAHELLHAQMSKNECYIGGCLKRNMADSPVLSMLLKSELGDHIGNVLQHIRFYDLYLELGFEKSKFISDYNQHKCTEAEISSLEMLYRNLNYFCLDTHLGKLFAVLCDPNPELDYSLAKVRLRKLEPKLFHIASHLVEQWKQTEIDNYRTAVTEFIANLEKWVKHKRRYGLWAHKLGYDIRQFLN